MFARSSDLALQVIGATAAGVEREVAGLSLTCVALAALALIVEDLSTDFTPACVN